MKGHPLFEIHCLSWSSTSSERLPILLDPVACVCEVLIEVVTCVQTVKTEGVTALYKGFIPNWLRLGPWNIIVSFYTGIFRCTLSDPTPPWHRGFLFSAGPTCVCVCMHVCVAVVLPKLFSFENLILSADTIHGWKVRPYLYGDS